MSFRQKVPYRDRSTTNLISQKTAQHNTFNVFAFLRLKFFSVAARALERMFTFEQSRFVNEQLSAASIPRLTRIPDAESTILT
jgi:hypothetical protein